VGPLARSKRGILAILAIVNAFSKFVSFYPMKKITSQAVSDCLGRRFVPTYGTPESIVTDKASVLVRRQVKDMCFWWGIPHITTIPYYPQASLAEMVNRNLKLAFRVFHHGSQNSWDEDLTCLSLAFNTAVHESKKCTPDKLFLGCS
jgi:hypothetical protein